MLSRLEAQIMVFGIVVFGIVFFWVGFIIGRLLPMTDPSLPYGGASNPNSGYAGSETSKAAAIEQDQAGATSEQQSMILGGLGLADTYGMTVGEVRAFTGYHHGTASRALSDMHAAGLVCRLTETRDRAKVYVHPDHVAGRETEPQGQTATVKLLDDMATLIREVATEGYYGGNDRMNRALALLDRYDNRRNHG